MRCDTALTPVGPLGERLFLAPPAQTGLGQGRGFGVEFVEMVPAGACSLAANHLYEQPRCPVPHTVREVLLPCDVIQLLASDVGATAEEPVGQPTMQRLAVLRPAAVQLGHPRSCLLGRVRPLPGAAARL